MKRFLNTVRNNANSKRNALKAVPAVVSTFAGSGYAQGGDGTGIGASFFNPAQLAIDSSDTIYIADSGNQRIRKMTIPGAVVTTLAGSGQGQYADGTGTAASFWYPDGITVSSSGTLYVSDRNNLRVRVVTASGVVTTLAGSDTPGSTNGTGVAASFNYAEQIAIDSTGNLYLADYGNDRIRKITLAGVVTTFATGFNRPIGVAVDTSDNLYIADTGNNIIVKITPQLSRTTFAGSTNGSSDGTGTNANFSGPMGMCFDSAGNMYVADCYNNRIRKITPAGVVSTIAGTTVGYVDGTGNTVKFNSPVGVAVDSVGNIYVSDNGNHRIRKITIG